MIAAALIAALLAAGTGPAPQDPSAATSATKTESRPAPPRADPDAELLRNLELLEKMELLQHLELFD